jgi:hypothetical protein
MQAPVDVYIAANQANLASMLQELRPTQAQDADKINACFAVSLTQGK